MKKMFLAASGLFSAVPGLAILASGVETPPGYRVIFGGIVEAFGVLSLIALSMNESSIRKISTSKAIRLAVGLGISSMICLVGYLTVFQFCVFHHPTHGSAYYPLWTGGHLADLIATAGGRYAALDRYGAYPIAKAVSEMPGHPFPLILTTTVLLLLYQAIFTTLATSFALLAFHKGERPW